MAVVALVLLALMAAVGRGDDSIVMLANGVSAVQGTCFDHYRTFLGIPYATPPVGTLRFKRPVPYPAWQGVRKATGFGAECMQSTGGGEDCLHLNVYAPRAATISSPLPVMFWIHGGCWMEGAGSDAMYNATDLMLAHNDLIVVTMNYRLGAFGYLGSQELAAEDQINSTGNYGLLDQRMALAWVQENIAAFGGDPGNVTAFGESAGSGSISDHLVMPHSAGLFQRAILESGPIATWSARPLSQAQAQFDQLLQVVGCQDAADALECLRGVPASQIQEANVDCFGNTCCYFPVVDGAEIRDTPSNLAERGELLPNVSVMLGTNANEATIFLKLPVNLTTEQYQEYLVWEYGSALAPDIFSLYPPSAYASPWWAAAEVYTNIAFTCPARRTARWLARSGGAAVYLYYWTHVVQQSVQVQPYLGAYHSVELAFVWDQPSGQNGNPWTFTPAEQALQLVIGDLWTSFATTGAPSAKGALAWPMYTSAGDANIVLDETMAVQSNLFKKFCDFFDLVGNYTTSS